jgi:hypothetical protein
MEKAIMDVWESREPLDLGHLSYLLKQGRSVNASLTCQPLGMTGIMAVCGSAANGGAVLPAGSVVQFDRRASAGGALVRVRAEDLYDSCGRLQAAGVRMVNSTCRRARSGLTVVYDAAFLEGTRAIAGVAIRDNVFAAVGDPPAANMSQVLVCDADAQVARTVGERLCRRPVDQDHLGDLGVVEPSGQRPREGLHAVHHPADDGDGVGYHFHSNVMPILFATTDNTSLLGSLT